MIALLRSSKQDWGHVGNGGKHDGNRWDACAHYWLEMKQLWIAQSQYIGKYATNPSCKFDVNSEQMMVYTDIIDYSTVSSQNVTLLWTMHLELEDHLVIVSVPRYRTTDYELKTLAQSISYFSTLTVNIWREDKWAGRAEDNVKKNDWKKCHQEGES